MNKAFLVSLCVKKSSTFFSLPLLLLLALRPYKSQMQITVAAQSKNCSVFYLSGTVVVESISQVDCPSKSLENCPSRNRNPENGKGGGLTFK